MIATLKGKRIRVLTQYKFSLNPTKYPIGPTELKTIAAALRKSEAECNKSGKFPTQKILRSNRLLSPRAQSSRVLTDIKFETYDPAKARRTLQSHAARFGILEPEELHRGIQQVIGELAVTSASPGSHRLTRAGFDKALTGYHRPQSIFVNDAAARLQEELEQQKESCLALDGSQLVDRVVVEDAMAEWTNDALVVFTGGGGLGKTTALWQVLRAGVDEASRPRKLAALITAEVEMPASFSELVDQWRGAAPTTSRDELALRRLEHANKSIEPPILLLGLDGVDESHVSSAFRDAAGRIIGFFWSLHQRFKDSKNPPPIRLLVSCRQREDVEKYFETATGRGIAGKAPKYVLFDRFSISEIQALLRQPGTALPHAIDRLLKAAEIEPIGEYATNAPISDPQAVTSLSMLRHPILWSCFLALTSAEQSAFVDGDAGAQNRLAAQYFDWFMRRAQRRLNFVRADVEAALCTIAQRCSAGEMTYRLDLWEGSVIEASGYSISDARRLYREGISAGMIESLPPAGGLGAIAQQLWRWQHAFFWSHLRGRREE